MRACTRLLTGFWMLYSMPTFYVSSCSFHPEPSLSLATHSHCVLCWLHHRTYQNYKSLSSIHTAVTMNTQHLTGLRHPWSTPYTGSLHIKEAEGEYSMNPGLVRQIPTHPPPSLTPPHLCAMVHRSPHTHHPVLAPPHLCATGSYYGSFAAHHTNPGDIFWQLQLVPLALVGSWQTYSVQDSPPPKTYLAPNTTVAWYWDTLPYMVTSRTQSQKTLHSSLAKIFLKMFVMVFCITPGT